MVQSQPRQRLHENLSQKTLHKNRASGVAQGEGPELQKKKKKRTQTLNTSYCDTKPDTEVHSGKLKQARKPTSKIFATDIIRKIQITLV
jgi:hypothetical protein